MKPTAAQATELRRIRKELANLGLCLPGSINIRTGRCGKTITRLLSQEQLDDYQPYFDNHRRLKDLVHQIEQLSLDIVEADERWNST